MRRVIWCLLAGVLAITTACGSGGQTPGGTSLSSGSGSSGSGSSGSGSSGSGSSGDTPLGGAPTYYTAFVLDRENFEAIDANGSKSLPLRYMARFTGHAPRFPILVRVWVKRTSSAGSTSAACPSGMVLDPAQNVCVASTDEWYYAIIDESVAKRTYPAGTQSVPTSYIGMLSLSVSPLEHAVACTALGDCSLDAFERFPQYVASGRTAPERMNEAKTTVKRALAPYIDKIMLSPVKQAAGAMFMEHISLDRDPAIACCYSGLLAQVTNNVLFRTPGGLFEVYQGEQSPVKLAKFDPNGMTLIEHYNYPTPHALYAIQNPVEADGYPVFRSGTTILLRANLPLTNDIVLYALKNPDCDISDESCAFAMETRLHYTDIGQMSFWCEAYSGPTPGVYYLALAVDGAFIPGRIPFRYSY